jgi:hypothetical protein
MITGVWKGKIGKQKAEVKFIQKGDSLTGTSYYYESAANYRRYSIKGYFDATANEVVWWDDQLIEEKTGRFGLGSPGKNALLSHADFNCPGGGVMMLDGKAGEKQHPTPDATVHLDKTSRTNFNDEWDYVIDNFTIGGNDPDVIDSVTLVAFRETPKQAPVSRPVIKESTPPIAKKEPPAKGMVSIPAPPAEKPAPVIPKTIEEKFIARTPKYVMDIPLQGDSIELRFYDNAEIDGDSISLFLNEKLVFQHIRLLATPYKVKLAINDLKDTNELVMVAENLGKIPPNTSYMVAIVNGQRYEANLQSTEEISAMIKLIKPKKE